MYEGHVRRNVPTSHPWHLDSRRARMDGMTEKDRQTKTGTGCAADTMKKVWIFGCAGFVVGAVGALMLVSTGITLVRTQALLIFAIPCFALALPLPFLAGSLAGLVGYLLRTAPCPACGAKVGLRSGEMQRCRACGAELRLVEDELSEPPEA